MSPLRNSFLFVTYVILNIWISLSCTLLKWRCAMHKTASLSDTGDASVSLLVHVLVEATRTFHVSVIDTFVLNNHLISWAALISDK